MPPALRLGKNLLLSFGAGNHWCLVWWESAVGLCLLSLYHLLFHLESLKQYYLDWNRAARQQGPSSLQEGLLPSAEGSFVNGNICSPTRLQSPSPARAPAPCVVTSATPATATSPETSSVWEPLLSVPSQLASGCCCRNTAGLP